MMGRIFGTATSWLGKLIDLLSSYPPEVITLAGPLGDPLYWLSADRLLDRANGSNPGEVG